MAHDLLSYLMDATLWFIVFAAAGAQVERAHTAAFTFAFSLLVSITLPLGLSEVRQLLLADVGGQEAVKNLGNEKRRLVETLVLYVAILVGAIFTQLDWAQWFQEWPFPALVSFALARGAIAVVARRHNAQRRRENAKSLKA
ncbi:hypothetical protein DQ04_04821020 [Trypanosoma grayi]|uniref:hypothetical protein n=1 Tax=Trypanosoma grayi TaxID=71804 RepID=UPI0004F48940|nr:hypothetical protein DQ04_04821020 [Trypanosoma grayi]KEG09678.1 hypothetical protein DQ04_04821020 [Trypanosoma grayi]